MSLSRLGAVEKERRKFATALGRNRIQDPPEHLAEGLWSHQTPLATAAFRAAISARRAAIEAFSSPRGVLSSPKTFSTGITTSKSTLFLEGGGPSRSLTMKSPK